MNSVCLLTFTCLISWNPPQDETQLAKVRKQVRKAEKKFFAVSSKYRLIKNVSKEVILESADKSNVLSVSDKLVDGIWHGDRYSTISQDKRKMGDGSKLVRKFIAAYNGKDSFQNVNFERGCILNDKIVNDAVNPTLIAAPQNLGSLGSLDQILNIQLKNVPFGSAFRYWKNIEYQHLGEVEYAKEKCHKIVIIRRDPNPPNQPQLRQTLWIAPKRNWQIVASEHRSLMQHQLLSTATVTQWKKIDDKTWIPQRAEIKYFSLDKLGNRRETSHKKYELIDCRLRCDPKDSRFNNVDFRPGMKIENFDIKNK